MASQVVSTIGKDKYITKIKSPNGNSIVADEPEKAGGQNMGLKPGELLASALASCVCITLRMYADRKEWPLERVEVTVDYEYDREKGCSNIKKTLELFGELDDKQKNRLYAIAERCPISLTLSNPIKLQTTYL